MRRANVISGMVLAIFAILTLLVLIPWQIEEGPRGMMSPRLVPQLVMGAVLVLSAILVLTNLGARATGEVSPFSREELRAFGLIGVVFALALGSYFLAGALAFGLVLVGGALLALGERRPLVILTMPLILMLMLWALFYKVLGTAIL